MFAGRALPTAINVLTLLLLAAGTVLSLVWLVGERHDDLVEPGVSLVVILAAVTGIFAERLVSAAQRRRELVGAVLIELDWNEARLGELKSIVRGPVTAPRVMPRFHHAAAETAITSGTLGRDRSELLALLRWRGISNDANHRLDLLEMVIAFRSSPAYLERVYEQMSEPGGLLDSIGRTLDTLATSLADGSATSR